MWVARQWFKQSIAPRNLLCSFWRLRIVCSALVKDDAFDAKTLLKILLFKIKRNSRGLSRSSNSSIIAVVVFVEIVIVVMAVILFED